MEYRTLDITLNSATEVKKPRFFGRYDVYAVATVSGNGIKLQKCRTTTHKNGDSNPTWNFPMKFTVVDTAGVKNDQILVVKIKGMGGLFGDKTLGFVHVPIKDLLDGVRTEGKAMQIVSYQLISKSGKRRGVLNFTYKNGGKFAGMAVKPPPVTAYRPGRFVGSSSSYKPSGKSNSSMGFGTGLVGGLLLADIATHAAQGYGGAGGCGGGSTGCGVAAGDLAGVEVVADVLADEVVARGVNLALVNQLAFSRARALLKNYAFLVTS